MHGQGKRKTTAKSRRSIRRCNLRIETFGHIDRIDTPASGGIQIMLLAEASQSVGQVDRVKLPVAAQRQHSNRIGLKLGRPRMGAAAMPQRRQMRSPGCETQASPSTSERSEPDLDQSPQRLETGRGVRPDEATTADLASRSFARLPTIPTYRPSTHESASADDGRAGQYQRSRLNDVRLTLYFIEAVALVFRGASMHFGHQQLLPKMRLG
jgi:hypothetical protein